MQSTTDASNYIANYATPRDSGVTINDQVLDSVGSELGFFYFLMLACVFMLLNQLDGKIFRIKTYLMNRDFHLVESEGFVKFLTRLLNGLSWISLLMPFMALAVWAAGLIIRARDFGKVPVGGICVLLVGMAFFFFAIAIFSIKWNHYTMGNLSAIQFCMAFFCLTAYQFVAIFLTNDKSFFGLSAIFLNANYMIMLLILYLNSGIPGGSIRELLLHKMPRGDGKDPNRDQDFFEELKEERTNKQFNPTLEDVLDLFTIGKNMESTSSSSFGGGLQYKFGKRPICQRRLINAFFWCLATSILVVYSYVIKWYMNDSKLGFVIMIVILITDVFTYMFYNSRLLKTSTPLAIIFFLNRLLLFCLGGEYWIYGWMILFLIYGIMLSVRTAERRFPFENAFSDLNLDTISRVSSKVDISRVPEFLAAIITTVYAAIFTILYVVEPTGVPLMSLNIDNWDYAYYVNAVFCLLLISAFFTYVAVYRLFVRKTKRIEPKIHFYIKNT